MKHPALFFLFLFTVSVSTFNLNAAEIDPDMPLFTTGLGLDSIDALELALAISRRYAVELRADDENNERIFSSLRALADFVAKHRK